MTGCIGHQSSHTGQLFDLFIRSTGSGIGHHEDVVIFIQTIQQGFCQLIIGLFPGFYDFFVTLFFCDQTTFKVSGDFIYSFLRLFDHLWFLRRHSHIGNGYGHSSSRRVFVTGSFDIIQYFRSLCLSVGIDNFFKDLFQLFLSYMEINFQKQFVTRNTSVYKSQILWQDLVEQESTQSGFYCSFQDFSCRQSFFTANVNSCLQCQVSVFVSQDSFVQALVVSAFSLASRSFLCQVINTQDHIL